MTKPVMEDQFSLVEKKVLYREFNGKGFDYLGWLSLLIAFT